MTFFDQNFNLFLRPLLIRNKILIEIELEPLSKTCSRHLSERYRMLKHSLELVFVKQGIVACGKLTGISDKLITATSVSILVAFSRKCPFTMSYKTI